MLYLQALKEAPKQVHVGIQGLTLFTNQKKQTGQQSILAYVCRYMLQALMGYKLHIIHLGLRLPSKMLRLVLIIGIMRRS